MSSIDSRVVEMQFDNKAFGSGVKDSLNDLKNLKDGLKLEGATSGLDAVSSAASRFSLQGLKDGVAGAAQSFSMLQIAGITALSTLVNKAVDAGLNIAKSLTIAPVSAGLQSYADQINATQTILANTQAQGVTLGQVTDTLKELQDYANKTVYSFSDMTKNISLFTAAGVSLKDSTAAIKGISNLAAMSGVDSQHASGAMFQLSQAISSGTVKLQDWNSVMQAGLGGTTFQKALIDTAKVHGANVDSMIKKDGSFRESLKEGWLTSKVLTDTLNQFTGDLSDSQLKSMGYTKQQIADIQKLGKTALDSAVNIRTIPQMMEALHEEVATAWGAVFKNLFGDLNQATSLFSNVHTVIENILTGPVYALNDVLTGWQKLGGRDALLAGLTNAWKALQGVLGPIKEAFRDIFPATSAENLVKMTNAFRDFTAKLVPSQKTMENIKRTFAGLFSVLDIGKQIISAVVKFVVDLIGHFAKGGGGILNFTARIGDFLLKLDQAIKTGDYFNRFFAVLEKVIEKPLDKLEHFGAIIAAFVSHLTKLAGGTVFANVKKNLGEMSDAGSKLGAVWQVIQAVFKSVWQVVQPILAKIGDGLKTAGGAIKDFLSGLSFKDLLGAAGVTGILGIAVMLKKLVSTIKGIFKQKPASGGGIFDSVKESLEKLTDTLKSMQQMLKATTLLEIAGAILVLTIAVNTLSKIDAAGLALATAAITAMMVQLTAMMVAMSKLMGKSKAVKMDILAAGMILIAIAIDLLASAVKKLADLDWNGLAKGLTGVVVLLGAVAGAMRLMPEQSKMISSGAGLILLAEAIKILVDSVQELATMSWADMAKGLTGVAALLLSLDLFTKFNNTENGGIKNGVGLILLATAIKILASAMQDMAALSWQDIAKGLTTTAGGLGIIAGALKLMPADNVLKAASIVIVAAALKVLASAMADMGQLSWQDIGKGLATTAGGLLLIGGALKLIPSSSILQAAALLVVTAALKILASAMADMGGMSWGEIARSLVELAGSLVLITAALYGMEEGVPGAAALIIAALGLKVLAGAMVIMGGMSWSDIGAALVVLTGGLLALAVGLTAMMVALPGALALAVAAPALAVFALAMTSFSLVSWGDIGKGVVSLLALFAALAIGGALSPLIGALAVALGILGLAVAAFGAGVGLIGAGVKNLADGITQLAAIDSQSLRNLSDALDMLIGKIPQFATALAMGFVDFAQTIADHASAFGDAAAALLDQFIRIVGEKMPEAVNAMADGLVQMLGAIDARMPDIINKGADIIVKFLNGLATRMPDIAQAGTNVVVAFLNAMAADIPQVVNAGFNMIISVMNGIADSIRKNMPLVIDAAKNIGKAIIDGITGGVNNNQGVFMTVMKGLASAALGTVKSILGIHSPSKEFEKVGQYTVEGFVLGLVNSKDKIDAAVKTMTDDLGTAMDAATKDAQDASAKIADLTVKRNQDNAAMQLAAARLRDAQHARKKNATTIQAAKDTLAKATQTVKDDNAAIAEQNGILAQANDERNRAAAASNLLSGVFQGEIAKLRDLADQYDGLTQQIKDANDALDSARKTRDDYNKNVTNQYDALPGVSTDTDVSQYVSDLQTSITKTTQFTGQIQKLRDMGLNDQMYKDLIAKGPDALGFVNQMVDGGQTIIDEMNVLDSELADAASALGTSASTSLYQAGVDSAQGLVDGLNSSQQQVKNQMVLIANNMTQSIKDQLGIHSPSTEMAALGEFSAQGLIQGLDNSQTRVGAAATALAGFVISGMNAGLNAGIPSVTAAAESVAQAALAAAKAALGVASPSKEFIKIGQWTSQGMADGLTNYSGVVSSAASGIGNTAIAAMTKTISGLGDRIGENIELNPVITPVLDLSSVQKDASALGSLLSGPPVSVGNAYATAADASAGYRANQLAMADAANTPASATQNVTFVQNNNSPKALTSATIYRQTKNQLSVAKGALTK